MTEDQFNDLKAFILAAAYGAAEQVAGQPIPTSILEDAEAQARKALVDE
jgi:hypothetical protein